MMTLNDLYIEVREMISKTVDAAINEGNLEKMLSVVSKAEDELKNIIALSISMESYVYVKV